jgi:hypothetical protein
VKYIREVRKRQTAKDDATEGRISRQNANYFLNGVLAALAVWRFLDSQIFLPHV